MCEIYTKAKHSEIAITNDFNGILCAAVNLQNNFYKVMYHLNKRENVIPHHKLCNTHFKVTV